MQTIHDIGAFVSLVLTPLTVILSLAVLTHWVPGTWIQVRAQRSGASHYDRFTLLLMCGVVASFVQAVWDNTWWGLAWSLEYVRGSSGSMDNFFFRNGAISNILGRQGLMIVAAIFHLLAVEPTRAQVARLVAAGVFCTCAFVAFLQYFR